MIEEWREIKGYEREYSVSNLGNVYSHKRNKVLKKTKGKHGYYTVSLFHDRARKEAPVHRLVAMAFIPNPSNLPCVNHKDECKTNNTIANLEWCTHLYNNRYGTARDRATKSRQKRILQYSANGDFIREWVSIKSASESLGINASNLCQCCKGNPRNPKAGGFVWRYSERGCNYGRVYRQI